jgi:hypothetical protein
MRDRDGGDRGRGRGHDSGGGSGGERDAGKRTPDEEAIDRVYCVWQEVESAATRVEKLSAIVRREEWRTEREKLQQTHDSLVENLKARELDAKASARARDHYTNASKKLGDITTALASAQEPLRRVPPVAGEVELEPSIIARSAVPDDVLAWVAGLGARERSAIEDKETARWCSPARTAQTCPRRRGAPRWTSSTRARDPLSSIGLGEVSDQCRRSDRDDAPAR